ncbi:unnamed protein product [Coregonus sp. 'balchen']|nr:unnamed protein product [Coregonus sp. 'balchen']
MAGTSSCLMLQKQEMMLILLIITTREDRGKMEEGGVFFVQESFVLQHASAIFEWVFCIIIMLFYGTFAFEFAGVTGETVMVLARGGALGPNGRDHKVESRGGPIPHPPETISML